MSKSKHIELLAPAGSIEKMKYAFAYGADAVYMGIPDFSLRVRINNFTMDDVQEAIEYAHELRKKVYVTVNIVAHNKHLEKLPAYLKKLNSWKPDALIVSDPGVIAMVKKYAPQLPIHLSTQANATNWQTVKFWHTQGLERVVLGREVTLADMEEIHKKVPRCELEYFIHGAMCMSYSGRCMLSAWLTGRSANLGDCAQPCRWKFEAEDWKYGFVETTVRTTQHPNTNIPVEEDRHGTYIFNSKDLCLIEYVPELIEAGVISFKIEGRAKSAAYLASVIKAYRQAFDFVLGEGTHIPRSKQKKYLTSIKKKNLDTLIHRGYTTGFLFGRETVEQDISNSHTKGDEEFVGEVLSCKKIDKKYKIRIRPHNAIRIGDTIRIMQPSSADLRMRIQKMYNELDEQIDSAHGGNGTILVLILSKPVQEFGVLFKRNI